jgi:L-lactate dehydrogenase (cytochrome)
LPSNLDKSKFKGSVDQRTITDEWSKPPPQKTTELKLHEKPDLDTVINANDFEEIAQRTVSKKTWAFYSSADTDCLTRDRNKSFFGRIWFRPRLLRDIRNVSPAAMARLIHPQGEKDIARGCIANRVPQVISTNASFPIEEIMASTPRGANHPFFFQLYVNKDRSKSELLLKHVRSLGVDTVFVTIDGPTQGKREADERVKADEGISSPMSGAKASNDKKGGGLGRVMGSYIAPDFTWNEFTWLRQHWDGKIVVKGVQSWQDAKMCADAGLDGVLLSNHGGRNLDT